VHPKNILHTALLQLIVDETNRFAQQEISESISPFTFHSMIGKCEYVSVDEMYVVLALFMLLSTVQNAYTYIIPLTELGTTPFLFQEFSVVHIRGDRLCGIVVRVPGYRSRGPGFDS
jgi:hypothetical protein